MAQETVSSAVKQAIDSNRGLVVGNIQGRSTILVNPVINATIGQSWPIDVSSLVLKLVEASNEALKQPGSADAASNDGHGKTTGSKERVEEIESLRLRLKHALTLIDEDRLEAKQSKQGLNLEPSKAEAEILKLAKTCLDTASSLEHDVDSAAEPSRFSVHRLSKTKRRKKPVDSNDVAEQLRSINRSIVTLLKEALENDKSSISRAVALHRTSAFEFGRDRKDSLDSRIDRIKALLQETVTNSTDAHMHTKIIIESVEKFQIAIHNAAVKRNMLEALQFPEMKHRQRSIEHKHGKTFEWVFDNLCGSEPLHFADWLRRDRGLCWISGKPGCGKSTLIEWLVEDHRTKELLKAWAGDKDLYTGVFFFWHAGTSLQRSQEGLLRTLLFQLVERTTLDDSIWKEVATHYRTYLEDSMWTVKRLFRLLDFFLADNRKGKRFCLFIDGLDEYSEQGNSSLGDLAGKLRELSNYRGLKICVASRRWRTIEAVFKDFTQVHIELHLYTKPDLHDYARDMLCSDPLFIQMMRDDHRYATLPDRLVQRAEGVFLWIHLVLRDLKRSLSGVPTYEEVVQLVEKFPTDLDDYFQRILDSVPADFAMTSAQMILMCLFARKNLPVVCFACISETSDAVERNMGSIASDLSNPDRDRLEAVVLKYRDRVLGRCLDLLESHVDDNRGPLLEHQVGFMHRTIFDYLSQNSVYKELCKRAKPSFSPDLSLCQAMLLVLMVAERDLAKQSPLFTIDTVHYALDDLMNAAFRYEKESRIAAFLPLSKAEALLERLPVVIKDDLRAFGSHSAHLLLFHMACGEPRYPTEQEFGPLYNIVFARAIQLGFTHYVRYRIGREAALAHTVQAIPTLLLATFGTVITYTNLLPVFEIAPQAQTCDIILEHLQQVDGRLWDAFVFAALERLYSVKSRRRTKDSQSFEEDQVRGIYFIAGELVAKGANLWGHHRKHLVGDLVSAEMPKPRRLYNDLADLAGSYSTPYSILSQLCSEDMMSGIRRAQPNTLATRLREGRARLAGLLWSGSELPTGLLTFGGARREAAAGHGEASQEKG